MGFLQRLRWRRVGQALALAVVLLLAGLAAAGVGHAQVKHVYKVLTSSGGNTIQWTGHGSESVKACAAGQMPYLHWIFTTGGNSSVMSATLTVSGAASGGGAMSQHGGSWSLDTAYSGSGQPTTSTVSAYVTYTGSLGNGTSNLNISDGCYGQIGTTTTTTQSTTTMTTQTTTTGQTTTGETTTGETTTTTTTTGHGHMMVIKSTEGGVFVPGLFSYTFTCTDTSGQIRSTTFTLQNPQFEWEAVSCQDGQPVKFIEHHTDGWVCLGTPNPANSSECIYTAVMVPGGVKWHITNKKVPPVTTTTSTTTVGTTTSPPPTTTASPPTTTAPKPSTTESVPATTAQTTTSATTTTTATAPTTTTSSAKPTPPPGPKPPYHHRPHKPKLPKHPHPAYTK